ncbi:MAG: TIR domain-containing protein [Clostridia bacterium]|nr:TIR domain-containing protein [Clostridia bacterium]
MAILRCKSCGGPLDVKEGDKIVECSYCNLQQTIPTIDDDFKFQMFNQANDLRRQFDFDGAKAFLQAIISRHPEESEAYWHICLCKYGIMYVEDQQTYTQIPTFYRMIPQSILSDEDYLKACKYAGVASWKYEDEAKKIEKLQKKIFDLSNSEDPYDIFICYKKTDIDTGLQTEDSKIAAQIYMKLIENGYRVFWAERSLPAGCEYEPYIYAALSTAKIMLVLGSDKRYFEAPWVKNEWIRFLDMMSRDSGKSIMTCYKNITADDIPSNLKNLQALDMTNMLFSSDLLERIQKKIPKKKEMPSDDLLNAFKIFQANNPNESIQNKEIAFNDGVYSGEAIAGKPHGYGIYHYSNGVRYEGNWSVGKRHGQGTAFFNNGDTWTGEWKDNIPYNGSGAYHFIKDNTTKCFGGVLKNGRLYGEGKSYVNGQVLYEGYFENGILNGQGTAYTNGVSCTGEFRQGRPWNAKGTFSLNLKRPAIFNGEWVNGLPHGFGIIQFNDKNDSVEGYFNNGLNGDVFWYFSDGRHYEGEISNCALSGQGKMFSKNDTLIYEGSYANGNANGYGTYYVNSSERYEGEFLNGKYNGQGTYFYPQGTWTGVWKDGQRWTGQGMIFFYDDNGKQTGKFFNGHMLNGVASGKGILRQADGTRFDGEFFNDRYYNGTVYNAKNQVTDTYVKGESQQLKAHKRNQAIAGTAFDILKGLSRF